MWRVGKYIPLLIGTIAFIYYAILSAKTYTWMFMSSDSGDWLMCSNWFVVPQPYGSPLYILLMRLIGSITDGNATVIASTILLSVVPSAITVMLVYLIVNKLVNKQSIAVVSSLVLLGSAVFLTQSTILEEYALATMFLFLGFWLYLNGHKYPTAMCWGLAVAVHVFVLGAILFWLIVEWRNYVKPLLVTTVPIIAAFYGFILLLMYLDTPRLLAGGLNFYSLNQYLTVTTGAILGQLSIFEAPERFLLTARLLLMSFGLALIPLMKSVRKPVSRSVAVMLGIILWTFWYQITNVDPAAWTFITYASPFIAVLVGVGLSRLSTIHLKCVAVGALVLIIANGVFLNANQLTNERPLATDYYEALQELPDGSIVLANTGSYSLGLFYAMSEEKDLVPLIYPYLDDWNFFDYGLWLHNNYDVETIQLESDPHFFRWKGTLEIIEDNLRKVEPSSGYLAYQGYREIYYADSPWRQSDIRRCLILEDTKWTQITKVVGLTGLEPEPVLK